jgi:hypothetical protein
VSLSIGAGITHRLTTLQEIEVFLAAEIIFGGFSRPPKIISKNC